MRALFLCANPAWEGGARIFATVAHALAERGHDTWVAAPAGSEVASRSVALGVRHLALPTRRSARGDARVLRAQLPRDFVDVVFVHDDREHLAAAMAVRGAQRGGVVRRVAAGDRPVTSWRRTRAERLVATRWLYTTESPPTGHAAPSGSLSPMRAELGVELPIAGGEALGDATGRATADAPAEGGATVLGLVATQRALRRATNVVRAAALLAQRHQRLRLRVLGSVAADEELKLLAAALGIARRVEWVGAIARPGEAMGDLAAAWVVADGDDAALGALDLMASGVAVLAERTAVSARYVSHGIQGTLMATLDPPLMAAETAVLLGDAERRAAMGMAGRARVEREYPFRDMVAAFEQAARAARERPGPRA